MVILKPQSEFGYAPPPQTPYSVITNFPGWQVARGIRDGDHSPMQRVVHFYPRFMPMHHAAQLGHEVAKHLGHSDKAALVFLSPAIWPFTLHHITHENRGEQRLTPQDVTLKCVDIAGHRVYAILADPIAMPVMMLVWQNPGIGISIRGAEDLLKSMDSIKEVPFDIESEAIPTPTWTPESEAHDSLRERIVELLHRAPIDAEKVQCTTNDVFLYPTGMAAIFHSTNLLVKYRPGVAVVLGIIFHNTYHHLIEECPQGMKHFGKVDEEGLTLFENWLKEERQEGRSVSYVFVEVPGNPTLETPDTYRLKKLSEEYGFFLIVDDTISGFANIDVLDHSDLVLSSLTKSFSGYANVMGGSIVLNPLSTHYQILQPLFKESHHNELFTSDAEVLLSNSKDFLERTKILNRNALVMANFLHEAISLPDSPIANVQYPSLQSTKKNYDCLLRQGTSEFPEPGYGCLLTVEFSSVETATAFYDRAGFYPSPHLGGHVTIMFAYNMVVFGKKPEEKAYMHTLGVKEASVRISAGLEDEEDLIDTLRDALQAAIKAKGGVVNGN
ncbi:related to O-succinylhomoserine (thiol)-lyase [Fusarium torulosum]|uniref:Related to O-succinylhomoserine (Thiol)-lyase n=1 Tax=Fusarium torulosum TaxID=33205 RepID=A0AAE8M5R5_9HYPO|nr:related to O-succinylhomoserine (thiol)-lyase [Fusarium torulosum]